MFGEVFAQVVLCRSVLQPGAPQLIRHEAEHQQPDGDQGLAERAFEIGDGRDVAVIVGAGLLLRHVAPGELHDLVRAVRPGIVVGGLAALSEPLVGVFVPRLGTQGIPQSQEKKAGDGGEDNNLNHGLSEDC